MNYNDDFIYRIETDTQTTNLIGVIDFCSELGGYPIYANNAYEWQLVQGILLIQILNFILFNFFIDRNNVKRSRF
jgi:hypothetical protein